eukprot:SAG31_NODE_2507_length_5590_cov_2.037880_7_plen_77_part_00
MKRVGEEDLVAGTEDLFCLSSCLICNRTAKSSAAYPSDHSSQLGHRLRLDLLLLLLLATAATTLECLDRLALQDIL